MTSRVVEPEILDQLPADNREAAQSRSDLVRLNALMRHAHVIRARLGPNITRVVDLGAGDGKLLLKVFEQKPGAIREAVLVDRQRVVTDDTLAAFRARHVEAKVVVSNVFDWLDQPHTIAGTAMVANLFLHHFQPAELGRLLELAAKACQQFIACEPRRGAWPEFAASLIGLIGCNRVTRHDAVVSVRAGFRGRELAALWPGAGWHVEERKTGLFSHLFVARRS